ncbi:hypothetical protein B0H13DRAFT_2240339 [Mycena leptocephala]|nr:hypothetical protein B0H13DRAFT_2240339 [Mycena leptocephala]
MNALPALFYRQSLSMERRPAFNKCDTRCPHCPKRCKNQSGLTQHLRVKHRPFAQRARSPVSSSGSSSARSVSPQNYQAGGDVEEWHSPSPAPPPLRIKHHPVLNATKSLLESGFRPCRTILKLQVANPDFKFKMDFAPKQVFSGENRDSREYMDFMSENWAWEQADIIVQDPATHGSTFVPVILGSDKTTIVATGQNKYYPLYMLNGLVHNNVQQAHCNAVTLIGFLAIPKTDRENQDMAEFHTFRRNLFHASLRQILQLLQPGMTTPDVIKCTASNKDLDGQGGHRSHAHTDALFNVFDHKTIWDDYGPFTHGFPHADIHELFTFKDHLVTLVGEYLEIVHGKKGAARIMADIDRRIAAVPPFGGLRHFLQGRGFKQWTGDDSKALMKVYLPAIEGYVPPKCFAPSAPSWSFATCKKGFVPTDFPPPQHSLVHYCHLIQQFGAPNGLCSSITESKHIKAVKQPWRRSSKFQALGQMLTINEPLDKLAASRVNFLAGDDTWHRPFCSFPTNNGAPRDDADNDDGGASDCRIYREVVLAQLPVPLEDYPPTGATSLSAPRYRDLSRTQRPVWHRWDVPERIRRSAPGMAGARYDCVFVEQDTEKLGFRGLHAVHVLAFMSLKVSGMSVIHLDSILRAAHLTPVYAITRPPLF